MGERINWPDGNRCAAMLTFDVDAETIWLSMFPESSELLKTLSMGTYGPLRGVPRILDLLDRYEVKSTFFVPGLVAEQHPQMVRDIHARGHEIANHGRVHENFSKLTIAQQRQVLMQSNSVLEDLTGEKVVGFRTPAGDFTRGTLDLLIELGFKYSSSMRGDDRPYRFELDGRKLDLIELPAHWELNDFNMFAFNYSPPMPAGQCRITSHSAAYDIWSSEFEGYYALGLMYVIMLHPQVIGTPGRIRLLERLIKQIHGCPGVWFARGCDVVQWFLEQEGKA